MWCCGHLVTENWQTIYKNIQNIRKKILNTVNFRQCFVTFTLLLSHKKNYSFTRRSLKTLVWFWFWRLILKLCVWCVISKHCIWCPPDTSQTQDLEIRKLHMAEDFEMFCAWCLIFKCWVWLVITARRNISKSGVRCYFLWPCVRCAVRVWLCMHASIQTDRHFLKIHSVMRL